MPVQWNSSPRKGMKSWHRLQHGYTWKHFAKWKRAGNKSYILCDAMYVKYSEQKNLEGLKDRAGQRMMGEDGEGLSAGTGLLFGVMNPKVWWWLYNSMNIMELPLPSPGDLPSPESEPRSPALQADSLPSESHWGSPMNIINTVKLYASDEWLVCVYELQFNKMKLLPKKKKRNLNRHKIS